MAEQWKQIPGYNGDYEVSNQGRVKSHKQKQPRILKAATGYSGYLSVRLSANGIGTIHRINRLVATVFLGPPPSDKHEAAHKDDVKANNSASNLEWLTHAENLARAAKKGRMVRGEKQHLSKVTESQVREIRRLYAKGDTTYRELGERFGLQEPAVGRIVRLLTWKHVA